MINKLYKNTNITVLKEDKSENLMVIYLGVFSEVFFLHRIYLVCLTLNCYKNTIDILSIQTLIWKGKNLMQSVAKSIALYSKDCTWKDSEDFDWNKNLALLILLILVFTKPC